jgi:hypothetical protein
MVFVGKTQIWCLGRLILGVCWGDIDIVFIGEAGIWCLLGSVMDILHVGET